MERKENQFLPLGVCQRLFNFIMNSIAARGLKRITLGPRKGYGLVEIPITGSGGTYFAREHTEGGGGGGGGGGSVIAIGGTKTSSIKVPLEGQESKHSSSPPLTLKPGKTQKDASAEVVPPTATDSEARGPRKKTGKETEPDKGEKGKASRPQIPITRVLPNIDEKSDIFIRRTKEALSRSGSGLDSKASP